ncbi:MAG: tetratricopeptide repeat protein [Bacteroidota bacterium]
MKCIFLFLATLMVGNSFDLGNLVDISKCEHASKQLGEYFINIQEVRTSAPKNRDRAIVYYDAFFSEYKKHVKRCDRYWQKEKYDFRAVLKAFDEDFDGPEEVVSMVLEEGVYESGSVHQGSFLNETSANVTLTEEVAKGRSAFSKVSGGKTPEELLSNIYFKLAFISKVYGNDVEMLQQLRYSLAFTRTALGEQHKAVAFRYIALGDGYYQVGDYTKALKAHTAALRVFEKIEEKTESIKNMHIEVYRLLTFDHLWRGEWGDIIKVFQGKGKAYIVLFGKGHPRTKRFFLFFRIWLLVFQTTFSSLFICSFVALEKIFGIGIRHTVQYVKRCWGQQNR